MLQVTESNLQLFRFDFQLWGQGFRQIIERLGQIAIVIQRVDQALHQGSIPGRQTHQPQLPRQMLAQGSRRGLDIVIVVVVIVEGPRRTRVGRAIAFAIAEPTFFVAR